MRAWPIVVCLWFIAAPAVEAQTESPDLADDVARLVRELDANELSTRQAAEKALVELGPAARGHLPAVTPRMAAEVKERLGRVRTAIEMAVAEAAAQPSLVTLAGEMTIADALQAIEEQTGNQIQGYERATGKTTVNFQATPYWEAVDRLLDEAELVINPYGGAAKALVAASRPDNELPRTGQAAYAGVFRFEVQRVESLKNLRNPSMDALRLALSIGWEPRLVPIVIRQQRSSLQATDDQGNSIEVSDSRTVFAASPADYTISEIEMVIPFNLPGRDAKKIASLKGTIVALIPGSEETFEFDQIDTARDVEQQTAEVAVTFERIRKNGDVYEVRMRARYENAAEALQSNRGWVYNNKAYLLDPDGRKIEPASYNGGTGRSEVRLSYFFPLPAGPAGYKFVYQTPAAMLRLPIEYELTDIALP